MTLNTTAVRSCVIQKGKLQQISKNQDENQHFIRTLSIVVKGPQWNFTTSMPTWLKS